MKTVSRLRSWRLGTCALLASILLTACGESPTAPSSYAPFSTQDLQVGTGLMAITGSVVNVNYTLWLYDASKPDNKGILIESNFTKGPFTFTLGTGAVIKGWDQGIPGMMEGGLRRITVPPSMAYGPARSGLIPPNATLLFEVELLTVS
jgi:FKBP-type peptidyl-prolyl cis-trans isomerase FkpA